MSNQAAHELSRERGMRVRAECISALTSQAMENSLKKIAAGSAAELLTRALVPETVSAVLADLQRDTGWKEECWVLALDDSVSQVPPNEFEEATERQRFSRNECLRKPATDSWALRGLLSAVVSEEVRQLVSSIYGSDIRFKSADIARYGISNYLRRHADLFEDRRFGLVWFFSQNWRHGRGGELIVEGEGGSSVVIPPIAGSIGLIAIRPACYHQVAAVRSSDWTRYSIATHFHEVL